VIEVVWQAARPSAPVGSLKLVVNGVVVQNLATTSTSSVAAIRLGAVASGSSSITEYFDAFSSAYSAPAIVQQSTTVRSRTLAAAALWARLRLR
jgi:hypothetical protein